MPALPQGMKVSCTHLLCASGAFSYLRRIPFSQEACGACNPHPQPRSLWLQVVVSATLGVGCAAVPGDSVVHVAAHCPLPRSRLNTVFVNFAKLDAGVLHLSFSSLSQQTLKQHGIGISVWLPKATPA